MRSCYIKFLISFLLTSVVLVSGPLTTVLLSRHIRRIQDVSKQSSFAQHLLYSLMMTSLIFSLYLYVSLIMSLSIYNFSAILYSRQEFYPNYFWSDVVAGICSVAFLSATIFVLFPILFCYFCSLSTFKKSKPLKRAVTSTGWSCMIVLAMILSFYGFHALIFIIVSPVATLVRTCMIISGILSSVLAFSILFMCCQPPYCSILKAIRIFLIVMIILIVNCSFLCLEVLRGSAMAPNSLGVNTDSIVFSAASSAIFSVFVYFLKVIVHQKISRELKVPEMENLTKGN